MKAYVVEYDFKVIKVNQINSDEIEHRIESFTEVTEFIECVRRLKTQDTTMWGTKYILNLKTYVGDLVEIDSDKVINPI